MLVRPRAMGDLRVSIARRTEERANEQLLTLTQNKLVSAREGHQQGWGKARTEKKREGGKGEGQS